MQIIAPGTRIFASSVKPGMIIELGDGTRFEVAESIEGYDRFTFVNDGRYRSTEVAYGDLLKLLGYFNPA